MAITVNNPVAEFGTTNVTSQTLSAYNVGAGTAGQRKLLVYAFVEDFSTPPVLITSVQYGGVSLTEVQSTASDNTSFGFVYELDDSLIGSGSQTEDIIVTYDQIVFNTGIHAFWCDKIKQQGATQTATNNTIAASTSISATLAGVSQDSVVLAFGGNGDILSMTADGAQVAISSLSAGSTASAAAYEIASAAGDYTQGFTYSSGVRTTLILSEYEPVNDLSGNGGLSIGIGIGIGYN